jgi:hypothetical protein
MLVVQAMRWQLLLKVPSWHLKQHARRCLLQPFQPVVVP